MGVPLQTYCLWEEQPMKKTLMITLFSVCMGISSAFAQPTNTYVGRQTAVSLGEEFLGAAQQLGVNLGQVSPGRVQNGVAFFPIPTAELDLATAKGEILHLGGLSLEAGGTVVELTQFIIDTTDSPVLTGLVKVNDSVLGRVELFDITLPAVSLPLPDVRRLVIPGSSLTLTDDAAAALNAVFNVTAFVEGLPIGTATISLREQKNFRIRFRRR